MKLVKRIDTVFLPVRNLEAAIAWYTEKLGLNLRWKVQGYAAMNVSETPLTLVETESFTPAPYCLFNFYAPDIRAAHASLKAAGVDIQDVTEAPDVTFCEFKDPDGNVLGLCWFPE